MPTRDPEHVRMSLGDHLDELRKRLIIGLLGPVSIAAIALFFGRDILSWLTRPAIIALNGNNLPPQLINTDAVSPFTLYIKVSLVTGLVFGLPWLLYQLWLFIAPGLYPRERRLVHRLIPGSVLMSVVGVLFMYYIMLPLTLFFLLNFTLSLPMSDLQPTFIERALFGNAPVVAPVEGVAPVQVPILTQDPADTASGDLWVKLPEHELRVRVGDQTLGARLTVSSAVAPLLEIGQYIGLVATLALAFAISFQLPVVMLALGWARIIDAGQFAKARKYAFFGSIVAGAVLTPQGDPLSLAMMSLPLYGLYELGLLLIHMTTRKQTRGEGPEAEA